MFRGGASVNIFGCCVSRDIFPDDQKMYNIQQYVAISSPMSNYLPAPPYEISIEQLSDFVSVCKRGDKFRERCAVLDHNNKCFDYIKQKKSDYLIVDIADSRLPVAQFDENHYISCAVFMSQNRKKFEAMFGKLDVHQFYFWNKNEWEKCISWFCDQLLDIYEKKNIILMEVYNVNDYLDRHKRIVSFPSQRVSLNNKQNKHIQFIYDLCVKKLDGCHIIRMPKNVFASSFHKLGLLPLHYDNLYYEYAFKCLQVITECDDDKYEKDILDNLWQQYSDLLMDKRNNLENDYYKSYYPIIEKYAYSFGASIRDYDKILENIQRYCSLHSINRCAFYGDFLITDVIMSFLKKCNVTFDYIICRWNNHPDIPLISPDSDSFPDTDLIIVCSVQHLLAASKKAKEKTNIPVISVFEFLPEQ